MWRNKAERIGMTRDELEFSISQYLDGTLAAAEASALEQRLATDSGARALLSEYQQLDRTLKSAPAPDVDFGAFSTRLSAALAEQPDPAQSYKLPWVTTVTRLALAACVVIAAGVGIRMLQTRPATTADTRPLVPVSVEPKQIVIVDAGPRTAPSTAPAALVVNVGPSAIPQDRPALARYQEDLLSRPSQVIIARSGSPAQDGSLLP
jgi:anti-sigma factor RsiW